MLKSWNNYFCFFNLRRPHFDPLRAYNELIVCFYVARTAFGIVLESSSQCLYLSFLQIPQLCKADGSRFVKHECQTTWHWQCFLTRCMLATFRVSNIYKWRFQMAKKWRLSKSDTKAKCKNVWKLKGKSRWQQCFRYSVWNRIEHEIRTSHAQWLRWP